MRSGPLGGRTEADCRGQRPLLRHRVCGIWGPRIKEHQAWELPWGNFRACPLQLHDAVRQRQCRVTTSTPALRARVKARTGGDCRTVPGPAPPERGRQATRQQSADDAEVLFTLMAERYERRSILIASNLVFTDWSRIFYNPMATAAAIDRLVHHSAILEFNVPSYRTESATHGKSARRGSDTEEDRGWPVREKAPVALWVPTGTAFRSWVMGPGFGPATAPQRRDSAPPVRPCAHDTATGRCSPPRAPPQPQYSPQRRRQQLLGSIPGWFENPNL
jgi:hypothetical protein